MKLKSIILILLVSLSSIAANAAGGKVYVYWVQFKDKANSTYSVDKPQEFLSEKAISRRTKNNVAATEEDIPVNQIYVDGLSGIKGIRVWGTSRWFNAAMVLADDANDIVKVQRLEFVANTQLLGIPNDDDFKKTESTAVIETTEKIQDQMAGETHTNSSASTAEKYSNAYYGQALRQIELLNGIKLHKMGFTGAGVTVAVIDAGFYKADQQDAFDKMFEEGRMLGTWDFMERNTSVYEDNNHGMAVLSCMAGCTAGKMVGTAPDASYYLLRTENTNFELPIEQACWVFAAEYADSAGCDVINSSLGYYDFDDVVFDLPYSMLDGKSTIITQAANFAAAKGMVVCISAGNEGSGKWGKISVPADAFGILAVGAVDKNEQKAKFSSNGFTSDGRVNPNVMSMGAKATVASSSNSFYPSNGTSFASPILCGMVACLVQANPTATSAQIVQAIEKSADMYPLYSEGLGYGLPDFYIAHVMLGSANGFNYGAEQLLEVNVGDNYLVYNLYSPREQTVKLEIKKKDKVVHTELLSVEAGSYNKNPIQNNKNLNKKGDYTFYVYDSEGKELTKLNFSR